jgi:peptidoglycan glycosyltransferase
MRRNIIFLSGGIAFAFIAMSAVLVYWMLYRALDLGASGSNPRVVIKEAQAIRGTITAADGSTLARTDPATGKRTYSTPSLSNVIGYSSARYGQADLEQAFGQYLGGQNAGDPFTALWRGVIHEPSIGADVQLTIMPMIQRIADTALGNHRGVIIALRPEDGAIVAIVSKPYFDANSLDDRWAELSTDPARPLLNRATQGLYPPGSTFKLVTNAAVLDTGLATPESTFTCSGDWVVQGFHISCDNQRIPATITLTTALAMSSNATYARLALALGAERLTAYADRFGFDDVPPSDLSMTASRVRQSSANWNDVLLASSGFGQGELQATPMEMALVTLALAGDGQIVEPYLVRSAHAKDGSLLYQHQTRVWRRAVSAATAETSRRMMVDVVDHGSGIQARIPGISVAGKTGTAQVGGSALPHAWFVCFAPANAPKALVVVMMENAGEGADVAAPAARSVVQAMLKDIG